MMNKWNTTSYIGVTNDISNRAWQHKQKQVKGFTEKYNLNKVIHYEVFDNPYDAISREKQLKRWSRKKKIELIKKNNPEFKDLSDDWN
ncbi:MAG: GIY-YIG nuclease family protein [Patescibacteria group bacterium]